MYHFSTRSLHCLSSCHSDLQLLAKTALGYSEVDFCITEGHRSVARQQKLYAQKKTLVDGINKPSKHNCLPARAFDFCDLVGGKASWDTSYLCYLGGLFIACGAWLHETERMQQRIRWGGNWDRDGIIITDQRLVDMPHIELL